MLTISLFQARKGVARDERAGGQGSSQGGQGAWTTKTKTRSIAKKAQGKPSANDEGSYHDQKLTTPQPPEPSKPQHNNAEQPVKSTLPMYDGQNDETTTQQQKSPCGQVACPRVSYDSSDPDRGFTEDTPESSVAANDNNYNGENYDPRFCNAFHHLHMEVHRKCTFRSNSFPIEYFILNSKTCLVSSSVGGFKPPKLSYKLGGFH